MATPQTVRKINRLRTIRLLMRAGPLSRAGLARELGMMRSTAGNLIDELLADDVLRPVLAGAFKGGRNAGRPGALVALNPDYARFVGIEIGVRRLRVAARDFAGRLRHTQTVSIVDLPRTPAVLAGAVIALARETVARLGWPEDGTLSLGVTFPGVVDRQGTVVRAPILGWRQVSLMAALRAAFPAIYEVFADNDANALAVAEMAEGAMQEVRHGACLWLDDGVGGVVVTGGTLVRGRNGHAGEFGHMHANVAGQPGEAAVKIEAVIGRQALVDRVSAMLKAPASLETILERLAAGDGAVAALVDEWQDRLAALIASLVSVLDPEAVLIGGPLARLVATDPGALEQRIGQRLVAGTPPPAILPSRIGLTAAALGIAITLQERRLTAESDVSLDLSVPAPVDG